MHVSRDSVCVHKVVKARKNNIPVKSLEDLERSVEELFVATPYSYLTQNPKPKGALGRYSLHVCRVRARVRARVSARVDTRTHASPPALALVHTLAKQRHTSRKKRPSIPSTLNL